MESLVRGILNYQFNDKVGDKLIQKYKNGIHVEFSKATKRARRIYIDNKLVGTIDSGTGFVILTYYGAEIIKSMLDFPKYRVVISNEAIPFVEIGKSVFNKFVLECDENILAKDVVFVVDKEDNLIATGISLLSGIEMKEFNCGVAVKVKHARKNS